MYLQHFLLLLSLTLPYYYYNEYNQYSYYDIYLYFSRKPFNFA